MRNRYRVGDSSPHDSWLYSGFTTNINRLPFCVLCIERLQSQVIRLAVSWVMGPAPLSVARFVGMTVLSVDLQFYWQWADCEKTGVYGQC